MTKTTISEGRESLTQILKQPARSHVVSELLDGLMDQFGGPHKFAAAFYNHFNGSTKYPMVRARMLSDVMKLFAIQSNLTKATATPVEGMTEAELQDAARTLFHVGNGQEASGISGPEPGGPTAS